MTTMNRELYNAWLEAGASEDKAGAAAISMSETHQATKGDIIKLEPRLTASITTLETKLTSSITTIESKLTASIAKLEKEQTVMKWMLAIIIATTMPLIKQLLS